MEEMRDDFFEDTALIGIATALPVYRFCWMVNNHFDINFIRDPEQILSLQKKGNDFHFPIYLYDLPDSGHKYLLYKLKSGPENLLPETKQMDYLWLVQTGNSDDDAHAIARELRNIPDVQLAHILSKDDLKNLNNLLV
jgi:hypothetical protein